MVYGSFTLTETNIDTDKITMTRKHFSGMRTARFGCHH